MKRFKRKLLPEPIYGIYQITNKINHKIYIGKSVDIEERWQQHKYGNSRITISKAIKKYGRENFDFIVLESINIVSLNKEEINEKLLNLEQKWIDIKKPYLKSIGYNINRKAKITYRPKNRIDTNIKISKIKQEMNHCGKPIIQYTLEGKFIREWKSAAEVERILGLFAENVSAVCMKKNKKCGNYIFRHKGDVLTDDDIKNVNVIHRNRKKVIKQSLSGDDIEIFNSIQDAANSVDGSISNIIHTCKGRQKTYRGFIWKYFI